MCVCVYIYMIFNSFIFAEFSTGFNTLYANLEYILSAWFVYANFSSYLAN